MTTVSTGGCIFTSWNRAEPLREGNKEKWKEKAKLSVQIKKKREKERLKGKRELVEARKALCWNDRFQLPRLGDPLSGAKLKGPNS